MSILIDELIKNDFDNMSESYDGKWYIASPLKFRSIFIYLINFKDALRVLRGKSFAVHYKEDEYI